MEKGPFRYIVFAFDVQLTSAHFKDVQRSHGMIFQTLDEANAYIRESISDLWADRFIVARFWADQLNNDTIELFGVGTVGFKQKEMKNLKGQQLDLFNNRKTDLT